MALPGYVVLAGIRANLRAIQQFVINRRVRGDSAVVAVFARLPIAAAKRGYAKLARFVNGRLLSGPLNFRRLQQFNATYIPHAGGHFYVIVMPGTLHFLLPCLALVPSSLKLALLVNGASPWECRVLKQHHPDLPLFDLRMLPGSSLAHGDVITLLLKSNEVPFGILDHDLYVFDQTVYDRLVLRPGEIALALFWERGRLSGRPFPHTFFLYFDPRSLRYVMERFRIDARLYRHAPSILTSSLDEIGWSAGRFPKDYLDYFDTLQLLFAAAESVGLRWRPIALEEPRGAVHLGGTSFSAYGTKDAAQLYVHLSFLEICIPKVRRYYAPLVAPYHCASELRDRLSDTDKGRQLVNAIDSLIERLSHASSGT